MWVVGIPHYLRVPFTGAKRNEETYVLSIGALLVKKRDTGLTFPKD